MRPLTLLCAALPAWGASHVLAVNVDSIIHPVTVEIIGRAIDQASRENASAILIRLNTPGGLIESTRQINEKIVASRVPVIAYVTPSGGHAASAGFFILEAADIAAMTPSSNTGAASPVLMGETMDPVMRAKIENDTSAWMRSIVLRRGRNATLAEDTIRHAKAFTEKEALEQHLIDLMAPDEHALLDQLDGREITRFDGSHETLHTRGAAIEAYKLTMREEIISAIADPNIGFILLVLGALGVYVEFSSPGLIFPGVAGGILALLGLSSLAVLPINWIGVALLILAAAMFILEAKFTSHGVLGGGGTIAMVLGALLLIEAPPELRIHLSTALSVSLPFAAITIFLMSLAMRAKRNKVITGEEGMIFEVGQARTALSPSGKVFVHGEYWDAISSVPVAEGGDVRVVAVEGMKLRVEPVQR
jgi:membrane-bound serine protease (ClpP class)